MNDILKKILEEIDYHAIEFESFGMCDEYVSVGWIKEIIRSHMDEGKNRNVPSNDGWILVSERLPDPDKIVYVTVHCSEWTSDYNSDWVTEGEKVHHEEEYIVNVGYVDEDGHWTFFNDDGNTVWCDEEFGTDKGCIYSVVTAWLPLPEPYKGE